MDTLRLEKGYRHWSHELDSETTPLEARLMHAVDLKKVRCRRNQIHMQQGKRKENHTHFRSSSVVHLNFPSWGWCYAGTAQGRSEIGMLATLESVKRSGSSGLLISMPVHSLFIGPYKLNSQFIVTARLRISDSDTKFRVQSSTEFMLCQQ